VAVGKYQKEVRFTQRIYRNLQEEKNEKEMGPRTEETIGRTRKDFDLRRHCSVSPKYAHNTIIHIY
jgi:non-homologous end joining protein Ku